jgi:protein gp37
MGKDSAIGWTHHTFNIVWGCTKVSEACKSCYAEQWAKKTGRDVWGASPRMVLSESYWKQPIKWDREAAAAGERRRVFCSSMADVFEDHPTVAEQRARLWPLIEATPNLDWLLLTKRPENMVKFAPPSWREVWPSNVWAGTTTETQQRAEERIPWLIEVPALIRFISVEPMLTPVDAGRLVMVAPRPPNGPGVYLNAFTGHVAGPDEIHERIHWVIIGGESGPAVRAMDIGAAETLAVAAKSAGAAVFVKQDSARKSGERGRLSDWMWALKEFPR